MTLKSTCGTSTSAYLLSGTYAATVQCVDVIPTLVHEATDQPEVAEDNGGHLSNVLVTLIIRDVATVIHQTGHQVAFAELLCRTFFNLSKEKMSDLVQ